MSRLIGCCYYFQGSSHAFSLLVFCSCDKLVRDCHLLNLILILTHLAMSGISYFTSILLQVAISLLINHRIISYRARNHQDFAVRFGGEYSQGVDV